MNLNKVSNIAVILAAAIVIGLTVKDRIVAPKKLQGNISRQFMGKPLPLPDKSALGSSATAVLFVSKTCHFCADSMPFYQELSSKRSDGLSVIVAVPKGRETREEGINFFAQHGVSVDAVLPVGFGDMGIAGTPTVVLLDATGRVKAVWSGILPKDKQAEVFSQINSLHTRHQAG